MTELPKHSAPVHATLDEPVYDDAGELLGWRVQPVVFVVLPADAIREGEVVPMDDALRHALANGEPLILRGDDEPRDD